MFFGGRAIRKDCCLLYTSKAISGVTKSAARLVRYEIRSVTSGTEALGEVTAQLEEGGLKVVGRGASTDVIEASAKAYIDGLNKLANLESKRVISA